jgi:aminoglycoside phosphotransferase (APT) family kinase protein
LTGVTEGIDEDRVGSWLVANVDGATPPFSYERIGSGRSNLTFAVTDGAARTFVLRRPPLGHVLATAHDMTREHRAMSAMEGTAVPVPQMLGLCTDEAVNDAPFYVMTLVAGEVVDSPEKASLVSEPARAAMAEHLIEVLAAMHDLDVDAVGLGDLGRREGYIERQLARWSKQWEGSKTRDLPAVDDVAAQLAKRVPDQQGVGVVHGDFRFGNCVTETSAGRIAAVLDWELCTLGDPLADLGYLGVFWSSGEGSTRGSVYDPTAVGGFGSFDDAVERYARLSARDLGDIHFYVVFQLWRSAVIMEGVYARYLHGAMGEGAVPADQLEFLGHSTVELSERAHDALSLLP